MSVTITTKNSTALDIEWTADESAVTYTLYLVDSHGNETVFPPTDALYHNATDLTPGTTYYATVQVANNAGKGENSTAAKGSTSELPRACIKIYST